MVPPKKRAPQPENPHANGPNLDVLRADPRVVIRRRPPGPVVPFVSDLRVLPGTDELELLGRRPYDDDDNARASPSQDGASQYKGATMALPKKSNPEPENPHANGPNREALEADPRVVIRHRPPGPRRRFVPDIFLSAPIDDLELIGRRPRDEDETEQ